MKPTISDRQPRPGVVPVAAVAGLIADVQRNSGEIPWHEGGKTDPWDHTEAAMGLTAGGYYAEAARAFEWLARMQLQDGSWYSAYRDGVPEDRTRETHMAAYVAVGVYHYLLVSGDQRFLKRMWPTVASAIDFSLGLQTENGEIYWAINPEGSPDPMALLTGCSSIYMSLKCGLTLAEQIGCARPGWRRALHRLGDAIRHRPCLFNMTKARYSMDWFYPILAGAITGKEARQRIQKYWKKFVIQDQGVRCVSDQPWVTVAETCEFCMSLAAAGHRAQAEIVFGWICDRTYADGAYWCGFTCPDMTVWPEEKLSWTNAAVLLAADAIYHLTPGGRLFCHEEWARLAAEWPS